ncbi:MAG TPA: hypothetical protein VNJ47_04680 [Nevskiales bacterium]|nr:hypothetical protein [Nevskiales bacterium]
MARGCGIIAIMRDGPVSAGLASALLALLALVLAGCEPEPPRAEDLQSDAGSLIVQAVSGERLRAWRAQRQLKKEGRCPFLPSSPEGPVGLATSAYGLYDNDSERVQQTIHLLLQLGCDIDQYSAVGLTPLHGAVIGRQPELLRLLLAEGADPKLRVIPIPGSELGRGIAHLDAYGVALVLQRKFPEDPRVRELLDLLKPSS